MPCAIADLLVLIALPSAANRLHSGIKAIRAAKVRELKTLMARLCCLRTELGMRNSNTFCALYIG